MDSDCDGSELGAAAVVVICAPGRWDGWARWGCCVLKLLKISKRSLTRMTDRLELKQALQTNGRRTGIHAITLELEGSRERWAAPKIQCRWGRCRPSATFISVLSQVVPSSPGVLTTSILFTRRYLD